MAGTTLKILVLCINKLSLYGILKIALNNYFLNTKNLYTRKK